MTTLSRLRPFCSALLISLFFALPAAAGTIVDHSGQTISFDRPFSRIVSLYGAHTENLFALGLDKEIIGVTRHEDYPPAALTKEQFHYRDGVEKFIAAKCDLVLIRPMIFRAGQGLVKKLTAMGVTVVSLQPTDPSGLFEYWLTLGKLTGRESQAADMVDRFKRELTAIKARTEPIQPKARVFFESIHAKFKTFANHSMAAYVLANAGGVNLAASAKGVRSTAIAPYGKEKIMALAKEIDVYLAQVGPMNRVTKEMIVDEPGYAALKAVKEGRVYLIDEKLVSRPTMRLLEGIKITAGLLYPEIGTGSR